MRRPAARRPRRLAAGLIAVGAAVSCGDDGPGTAGVSVVAVAARPCDRPSSSEGTGVVVGDGLVVTAAHVVDGPRRGITVDGAGATTVLVDARTDLALLAADVSGQAAIADTPTGRTHIATPAGDVVTSILRTGTLIVHDTSDQARYERRAHTVDVAVAEGTSGSPLVDATGAVVGIVVLVNRDDATSYAVTGEEISRFLDRRRRQPAVTPVPSCPE